MNDEKSGFLRKYNEMDYHSPLSPEALKSLLFDPGNKSYDKEKNDIWSLGITLLSTFVNEDFNQYYDWKSYKINESVIGSRILKLKNDLGYSDELVGLIQSMLEVDDFKRIGVTRIAQIAGLTRGPINGDLEHMYSGKISGGDVSTYLKKVKLLLTARPIKDSPQAVTGKEISRNPRVA